MVKKPHTNWDPPSNREGGGNPTALEVKHFAPKNICRVPKGTKWSSNHPFSGANWVFFFGREKDDEEIRANLFLPTIFLNRNIHASFAGLIV